ncbi:MAG TPA: ATP-binding cassette domain-containing protein [Terriglobales bacterium]|nr:ATP-binding cassette domain-containing protein [Terriglobales bacterium]
MLELLGVTKEFCGDTTDRVRALDEITLRVEEGSFVTTIGTNGSGKSTLLNAIAGAMEIDAGQIRIAEQDVTRWPEHARARLVGRVFQNPFSGTAPNMTLVENLSLAARRGQRRGLGWAVGGHLRDELRDRVASLGMGLEDRMDTPIGLLSGGQRQALTLLMATWNRPELLLLDEHTAALDPKTADLVMRLTQQIVASERLTTLMVTHSMQQAASVGDRLLMMHRGRIVYDIAGADKRRVRSDELLRRFEELRRSELLDATAAEMLLSTYV